MLLNAEIGKSEFYILEIIALNSIDRIEKTSIKDIAGSVTIMQIKNTGVKTSLVGELNSMSQLAVDHDIFIDGVGRR
jgi:hypothetical protein